MLALQTLQIRCCLPFLNQTFPLWHFHHPLSPSTWALARGPDSYSQRGRSADHTMLTSTPGLCPLGARSSTTPSATIKIMFPHTAFMSEAHSCFRAFSCLVSLNTLAPGTALDGWFLISTVSASLLWPPLRGPP